MSAPALGPTRLTPATSVAWLPLAFPLACGGVLPSAQLAYEIFGAPGAPLVVVLGGISAGRHVAAHAGDGRPGFWDGLVGPGRAIDPARVRVLGIDWLGGAGASTGPADLAPAPFPDLTPADQADALAHLLDQLGVARVRAIVGASYGGMVALAFACRHAARVERLVVVGAADRPDPLATAWRTVQRGIVALGAATGRAGEGLALARALAMATYRGRAELAARFGAEPTAVGEYLASRGASFAREFDPAAFAVLSRSIDAHRIEPAALRTPTTLVAFDSDQLVPVAQVRALAAAAAGPCRVVELASPFGHDAFLKETARLGPVVAAAIGGAR